MIVIYLLSLLALAGFIKLALFLTKKVYEKRATSAAREKEKATQVDPIPDYSLEMTNSKLSYNGYAWLKYRHKLFVDLRNTGDTQVSLDAPAWLGFGSRSSYSYPDYRYRLAGHDESGVQYQERLTMVLTPNQSCVLWIGMSPWDADFAAELKVREMLGEVVIPVRIAGAHVRSKRLKF